MQANLPIRTQIISLSESAFILVLRELFVNHNDRLSKAFVCSSLFIFCLVDQGQMYVGDTGNKRIQSFPFTTLAGSSNGTIILGEPLLDSDRGKPISVLGMAFDRMRHLLYLCNSVNQHVLILNTTENNIEITNDTELSVMNGSIQMRPSAIAIDEGSNSFYVSDSSLGIVVKFKIGSTTGVIVAGGMINNLLFNQLSLPGSLALDSSGYLYIADYRFNRIVQLLNGDGELRTIAGELFRRLS